MKKLLIEALIKFFGGVIIVAGFLFVPAGTLKWANGIVFMCLLFIPMFIAGIIMYIKNPELLKSRLNAKERQNSQKDVIKYSGIR